MSTDFGDYTPAQLKREKKELGVRLGRRLQTVRKSKGISQEELAAKAGYYRTYVGRVENGAISTSVHTIWRFAKALGVNLSELTKNL